jgi:hypothetical protein
MILAMTRLSLTGMIVGIAYDWTFCKNSVIPSPFFQGEGGGVRRFKE